MAWDVALSVASLAFSAEARAVIAGEETAITWSRNVVHAEADAGAVLGWQGQVVRWRAPPACLPVRVALLLQAADGFEESIAIDVTPGASAALMVVARAAGRAWEIQAPSQGTIGFGVRPGAAREVEHIGGCARARWDLPALRHPDWAVAAAFDRGSLVEWTSAPVSAPGWLEVEAPPKSYVTARIGTRRFFAEADAHSNARVRIEAPPGIASSEVSWEGEVEWVALSPPPVTLDQRIASPDGWPWIFLVDEQGAPRDSSPPRDAERIARGAYRWLPESARAVAAPARRPPRWRAAPGIGFGHALVFGPAASFARELPWNELDLELGGTLLLNGTKQIVLDTGAEVRQRIASLAAWGGVALPIPIGDVRLAPGLGLGGAVALRRFTANFQSTAQRVRVAPIVTASIGAGRGPLALELRLLASGVPLGVESSALGFLLGIGYRWPP